mmetsp:Transcript_15843/g.31797  ORF Transcript_15843/g.31797 Transcript_15843/m.31797 type:complete len:116 (+) Transcript_15843:218-565(+)
MSEATGSFPSIVRDRTRCRFSHWGDKIEAPWNCTLRQIELCGSQSASVARLIYSVKLSFKSLRSCHPHRSGPFEVGKHGISVGDDEWVISKVVTHPCFGKELLDFPVVDQHRIAP